MSDQKTRQSYLNSNWEQAQRKAEAVAIALHVNEQFPSGKIPFWRRPEYLEILGVANRDRREWPRVTKKFSKHPTKSQRYSPWHMPDLPGWKTLGYMDPYSSGARVPAFDPFVRDTLKSYSTEATAKLERHFVRDPCTPDRVLQSLKLFSNTWRPRQFDPIWQQAGELTSELFAPLRQNLDVIDLNEAGFREILSHMDLSSSPGLPFSREFHTQAECIDLIHEQAITINHFAKFLPPDRVRIPPCTIASRPGLIKFEDFPEKHKARGIWAYPAAAKVMEKRFSLPVYKAMCRFFGIIPYPTGVNMLKGLPLLLDSLLSSGKFGCITDISHQDASCHPEDIDDAFELIASWLNFGVHQSEYTRNRNVYECVKYYFKRTLVLLPNGQLVRKYGGVPSGTEFTQLIDTLIATRLAVFALLKQGYTKPDIQGSLFVVGDDVAMSVKPDFSVPDYVQALGSRGYEINPSKVMFSDNPKELKFLGYSLSGFGVHRPEEELMGTAFFPERFVGSRGKSVMRLIGQLYASGMCSPFFYNLTRSHHHRWYHYDRPVDDELAGAPSYLLKYLLNVLKLPDIAPDFNIYTILQQM